MNEELCRLAAEVGRMLVHRGETVAVAESSTGGLIAAALLSVPGASAFVRGGAVVYTSESKRILVGMSDQQFSDARAATELHATHLAAAARRTLSATWGIGETGAAGPTGNRYGDPAGHSCVAVVGGAIAFRTLSTGVSERPENMVRFALGALQLLADTLTSIVPAEVD